MESRAWNLQSRDNSSAESMAGQRVPCGESREGRRGAVGGERDFGPRRSEQGALVMVHGREVT